MRSSVCPALTTAAIVHGLSTDHDRRRGQRCTVLTHPVSLIHRGISVQINRATSMQDSKGYFRLTGFDLMRLFGQPSLDCPKVLPATGELVYCSLTEIEEFEVCSTVLSRIESGFTQVGPHRIDVWADAWDAVKQRFQETNFNLEALVPRFVGATGFLRLGGHFIRPVSERFELEFFFALRRWLFDSYLSDYEMVVELGSGSGFNVIEFSKIFPATRVVGADWSQAAVDILNMYAGSTGAHVEGLRFDFFHPSGDLRITQDSAVMTFCAFEQVGSRFDAILNFLIDKRPSRVVQVEPVLELYDPNEPFDQLAIRYHKHRGYLEGYYTALQELESAGQIKILHAKRTSFGSLFNECYNIIVWEPI